MLSRFRARFLRIQALLIAEVLFLFNTGIGVLNAALEER
jgi:hypothetical protein